MSDIQEGTIEALNEAGAKRNLKIAIADNAALRREVGELKAGWCEWLCEKCNMIHPNQGGLILNPCPTCRTAMTPTSQERRKICSLRSQLAEAKQEAQKYRT